ncbi:MAG: 5-dehydro-4-deoxy-D-glucuronate isomerase [Candidatus Reconcilbacillus cellulovorans]|uniref:4-deoxy-L-threo-5-hexosulose-uronate ketol-isomerase n=1 Tax=Candidatus Reconcilbacillus cellulovorans TaxID=1906605 RepID=A0A2A6DYQ9_9BACL|nr:MAG: 5-dehydro-4-deoxy-D-glucuronate isomerase [Candidatus Reconcilbacillus cellulovorans]
MEIRFAFSPAETKTMDTDRLRREYLVENLMTPGELRLVYAHVERFVIGGAVPTSGELRLEGDKAVLGTDFFLERRELGVINVGGDGVVTVDGAEYALGAKDGLYVGKGRRDVRFRSADPNRPAKFYLLSTTAHAEFPTVKITPDEAEPTHLGNPAQSNERVIYKYIHAKGAKSCQLVMGMTALKPNNMWNTMPCHLHSRRAEVYFYFDLPQDAVVFHFMGEPSETRHLVVRNEQAVVSPPWSIHCGVGTSHYAFIWGMGGENLDYADADPVPMAVLR